MSKKIIKLTESELSNLIREAVYNTINEMDGVTYARINNASQRAKNDIQNGIYQVPKTTTIKHKKDGTLRKRPITKTTMIDNDDTIKRATKMQPEVQQHWLKDYIGKTFKFFANDRLNLVAHVLFTLDKVTKLDWKKTILVGTVTYNQTQISGDGIIIDFTKNRVQYHERGSRYAYNLEIDNRVKPLWDKLLEQLRMALTAQG